jgi:hypothetical protein
MKDEGGRMKAERHTMDVGTSHVTSWGCGFTNTGDTRSESLRASAGPVPDNLYVVVGHSRSHNSPVEWAEEGLPRGLQSSKEKAKA